MDAKESLSTCFIKRDMLAGILDSVSDGILSVDQKLKLITFNRSAIEITGFSREEALGRSCLEVFRQILLAQECLVCRALEKGEYVRDVEREIIRKDGGRRLVLVTTTPLLDPEGKRTGIVVVFRDIQEILELREHLKGRSRFHQLIGKNHKMREIYHLIKPVKTWQGGTQ